MQSEKISDRLNDVGEALRQQPSVRDEVLRRVTQASVNTTRPSLLRRRWRPLAAIAACLVAAIAFTQLPSGNGASEAFAAAIDRVAKAHTFSCRTISQDIGDDGKPDVHETVFMFKEPDRSRTEFVRGLKTEGEVTITDLGKQRRLNLRPTDKVADLQDTSDMYTVDGKTGDLKPVQLDTEPRDQVLKLTAEAVKDLGTKQVDGKTLRVLQSQGKETVRTVYVDPQTKQPVRIDIQWLSNKDVKYSYTDIKIDQDLDDRLFALDVPPDYKLFKGGPYVPAQAYYSKMMTKMRNLGMACIEYRNDHKDQFPAELKDVVGTEGMTAEKLAKLIASPDKPNAPPAILYRRPRPDKEWGSEIILYEAPDQRRDNKVAAGFTDGHCQIMTQEEFDNAMK